MESVRTGMRERKRRDNWFRKGDFDTVVFVPATPGSQLKRRYVKEIKATEFKIKVVEQSGTTLKAVLQRSDPFKQRRCANMTALSAGLTGRDHAEVRALHMSCQFARLVNRRNVQKCVYSRKRTLPCFKTARGKLRYVETLL